MAGRDQENADLMAGRTKLETESDKLLAAHFADAIDLTTLKRHQDRIRDAGLVPVPATAPTERKPVVATDLETKLTEAEPTSTTYCSVT